MTEFVVQAVSFSDNGIDVQYMVLPDDVRAEGTLINSRQMAISFTAPHRLGAQAMDLRTAVEGLVKDVDVIFPQEQPYEPPKKEGSKVQRVDLDEDEDVGMGDGR